MTREAVMKKRNQLQSDIKNRKITGPKAVKRARNYISWCNWKMRKIDGVKPVKRGKKNMFNPDQTFLPDFLKQMDIVRMEELVADRIASKVMENQVNHALKNLPKVAARVLKGSRRHRAS